MFFEYSYFYTWVITSQYVTACQHGIGATIIKNIWLNLARSPSSTDIFFSAWNLALHACRIPCDLSTIGLHCFEIKQSNDGRRLHPTQQPCYDNKMTSLSLLSIGRNGLGHGRGLFRLRLGRSVRLICIIHPTGWMMGCVNQTCWIHTTGWTAGWMFLYTMQPIVQPAGQPVSCRETSNRLNNRLYGVIKHSAGCPTGCLTGLTAGCIV